MSKDNLNQADGKFVKGGERDYSWNEMCFEFTSEETGGVLTDDQIGQLSDEEFIEAVAKYTGYIWSC